MNMETLIAHTRHAKRIYECAINAAATGAAQTGNKVEQEEAAMALAVSKGVVHSLDELVMLEELIAAMSEEMQLNDLSFFELRFRVVGDEVFICKQ